MPRKGERRICVEKGCELEAAPRLTRCIEDWLARQPPIVRIEAAERRLSMVPPEYRRSRVPEREWPPGRRWCAGCQTFARLQDCSGAKCKTCASIGAHRSRIKAEFGIDANTYQWLMDLQLGRCAICRQRPRSARFAIDHQHGHEACGGKGCRGCVRGLLCAHTPSCNKDLLGAAHDSLEILQNAVRYLQAPPMSGEWEPPASEVEEWQARHPGEMPAPY